MPKIPEGFSTVTPSLNVKGAPEAIRLYEKAFGAKELNRMTWPGSDRVMHACIQIGTSKIFLADANPNSQADCGAPSVSSFYLYVDDVDTGFRKAKEAGLQEVMAPQDMFWGDRTGSLKDRFGNSWTLPRMFAMSRKKKWLKVPRK